VHVHPRAEKKMGGGVIYSEKLQMYPQAEQESNFYDIFCWVGDIWWVGVSG